MRGNPHTFLYKTNYNSMSTYFAYGSNMNNTQMTERCPGAVLLGTASLPGHKLAFTIFSPKRNCGCADIVSDTTSTVHGLLYELSESEMGAMDTFEGHPIHYRRISVTVFTLLGEPMQAETYEVVQKQEGLLPSEHYRRLILQAAIEHSFPEEYVAMLEVIDAIEV